MYNFVVWPKCHSPEYRFFPRDVIRPSIFRSLDSISSCRQNAGELKGHGKNVSQPIFKWQCCKVYRTWNTHILSQVEEGKMTPPLGRLEAEQCGSHSTGSYYRCPSVCSRVFWSGCNKGNERQLKWYRAFHTQLNVLHFITKQHLKAEDNISKQKNFGHLNTK